jgi:PBSX family phage terminase large subunit
MSRELRGAMAALFASTDREILLEGRAGTAKTTGICTKILHNCRKYPGSRHLICRETRTRLTESVMVTFERLLGETHPEVMRVKRLQRHSHRLWGSEVVWGGLDEPERLFSTEWDTVYVNEANEISLEAWELFGRAMRHGKMPYQQRVADVNPTFPGHWLNKRASACSDALRRIVTREDYNRLQAYNHGPQPGIMRRLVSVHQDNPGYWDMERWGYTPKGKEYIEEVLAKMSGHLRQRMFEGLWRAASGTVYPEFSVDRHVIAPFPNGVPLDWPIFAGWDPGYDHPTAILFIAVAPNGALYVIDEIYEGGKAVSEHCKTIRARNACRTVRRYFGDPQHAFSSTAQSPESIASQAKKCGIRMTPWPRSTDVEAMVNAVRQLLVEGKLKVFSTCTNTIDEFQAWRYKRTSKGEPPAGDDAFEDANNHAMDVIKGLVAAKLETQGKGSRVERR